VAVKNNKNKQTSIEIVEGTVFPTILIIHETACRIQKQKLLKRILKR
jgi:hypothetical protein